MNKIVALLLCLCLLPVYALAADYNWLIGMWVMDSATQDGQSLSLEEVMGEDNTGMLVFREGGAMNVITVEDDGEIDIDDDTWQAFGDMAISRNILLYPGDNGLLCAAQEGIILNLRRAVTEEIDALRGFVALPPALEVAPAESLWFLGAWEYLYSVNEGETEKSSMLTQPGDYARVTFQENNVYIADSCMGGQAHREELAWEIRDGVIYAGTTMIALLSDGTMVANESGDLMYFARQVTSAAPAASPRRELDATVTRQAPVSGVSGPRLTYISDPGMAMIYGVSPSARYTFGTRGLKEPKLVDRETGRETLLTFNAGRSAAGAALTQALVEDDYLRHMKKVAWSADERYAALVYSGTSKDNALCDLYVLDTQNGEIFAPAVWSKDRQDDHFGQVQDAAFAPDGTLYFLLETSGEGSRYFGPTMLYACNMDTQATTPVQALPGSVAPYPCLTCTEAGDVLAVTQIMDTKPYTYALLVGAQRENPRQIAIPSTFAIVPGKDDLLALQVVDSNVGASSTVSFLDLRQSDPTLFTGLVISSSGSVSQLPLLLKPYKEVPAGSVVFDRWREIRMGMKENKYLMPLAAAFSPDGKQVLLACSNFSFFLLDLETLQTTPVAPGQNSPKSIAFLHWSDNGLITITGGITSQLYRLEGIE